MKMNGAVELALLYSSDDVSNVKQPIVNTTNKAKDAKTETYTYDWLDRLRSASGGSLPSGLSYDHDAVGNAVKFAGKTCSYGSYNKITGDGTWGFSFDGNGNVAWKTKSTEKWNYTYNSLDQLTKVVKGTKSGQTWTWTKVGEYWYDASGMMAKSLQGGVETHYVYRGHDPLYEKTGDTSTFYFYANGRMVAKRVGSSDIYYYIADALGSTRQVWKHGATSPTFSVATYKSFGTPVTPSGTEKFQYAGEMLVGVAGTSPGLYYIGARWMDPELGRWLSLDPELGSLSMPQTLNRYVYCVNNPLRFTDPTGMKLVQYEEGSAGSIKAEEKWKLYPVEEIQLEYPLGPFLSFPLGLTLTGIVDIYNNVEPIEVGGIIIGFECDMYLYWGLGKATCVELGLPGFSLGLFYGPSPYLPSGGIFGFGPVEMAFSADSEVLGWFIMSQLSSAYTEASVYLGKVRVVYTPLTGVAPIPVQWY
jgi:RHS repeat-associated protein